MNPWPWLLATLVTLSVILWLCWRVAEGLAWLFHVDEGCLGCGGTGEITQIVHEFGMKFEMSYTCPECDGRGE